MSYFLATNETTVFHYGKINSNQVVMTGLTKLLFYDTEQLLITALQSYNQTYKSIDTP